MRVNVELSQEVCAKIEQMVHDKLDEVVNKVVEENVYGIITDTVKKQLRATALIYIQSPELKRKFMDKVAPKVDELISNDTSKGEE